MLDQVNSYFQQHGSAPVSLLQLRELPDQDVRDILTVSRYENQLTVLRQEGQMTKREGDG